MIIQVIISSLLRCLRTVRPNDMNEASNYPSIGLILNSRYNEAYNVLDLRHLRVKVINRRLTALRRHCEVEIGLLRNTPIIKERTTSTILSIRLIFARRNNSTLPRRLMIIRRATNSNILSNTSTSSNEVSLSILGRLLRNDTASWLCLLTLRVLINNGIIRKSRLSLCYGSLRYFALFFALSPSFKGHFLGASCFRGICKGQVQILQGAILLAVRQSHFSSFGGLVSWIRVCARLPTLRLLTGWGW